MKKKRNCQVFYFFCFFFFFFNLGHFLNLKGIHYHSAAQWSRGWELLNVIGSEEASCSRSLTQSCPTLCDPHELQHTRLPCPSLSPGVCFTNKETEASLIFLAFCILRRRYFASGGHSEILFMKNGWPVALKPFETNTHLKPFISDLTVKFWLRFSHLFGSMGWMYLPIYDLLWTLRHLSVCTVLL